VICSTLIAAMCVGAVELEKKGLSSAFPIAERWCAGLTPSEVLEIYAVREELEVMAVRIIPFPVAPGDISRLEELQRQQRRGNQQRDLLTVSTVTCVSSGPVRLAATPA